MYGTTLEPDGLEFDSRQMTEIVLAMWETCVPVIMPVICFLFAKIWCQNSLQLKSHEGVILPRAEQAYPQKPAQEAQKDNLGKTQSCP